METQVMYGKREEWSDEEGTLVLGNLTPRSDAMRQVEHLITGVDVSMLDKPDAFEQQLMGALTRTEDQIDRSHPDMMPSDILAMMKLSESYSLIEGDVYQIMIAPLDLGLTNIDLSCEDKVAEGEAYDFFTEAGIQEKVEYNWLYTQTYGQGFPAEVWDGSDLTVLYPNPKHVHIGKAFGVGIRDVRMQSEEKLQKWLKEQAEPPMWLRTGGMAWNEFKNTVSFELLPLNPDVVTHVHTRKLPHNRYAIPPIARAYRTISTRQMLEAMIRATIEGIMNQLWLYKKEPGEKFMRGEVKGLENKIKASRGDKTGHLVWPSLVIEQFVPKAIDQLVANDKWLALTHHIFRQLGVNIYVVSGEKTTQGRGDPLIDIKVYMARIEQDRRRQISWPQQVANTFAKKQGIKEPIKARFSMSVFDAEAKIRDRIMPLISTGLLDIQTALEECGYDYATILSRKKEQEPVRYLYMPQPSFAQVSLPKKGPATQTETDSTPGRTPDSQSLKASIEDYNRAISRSYQDVEEAEDEDERRTAIAAFIATLMLTNQTEMAEAYRRGYAEGGGRQEPSQDRIEAVVVWNNDYAAKFKQDLLDAEDPSKFRDRAMMYSPQGYRKAYMAGLFQVKREQGYTGWRRVLHPEASVSGPCDWCIADSQQVHPIEEEWYDHPKGVCQPIYISFWRGDRSTFPMRVPVLESRPTISEMRR